MRLVQLNPQKGLRHSLSKTDPKMSRISPARIGISPAVTPDFGAVRFRIHHASAKQVFVAGAFNNWNPLSTPLVKLGHGQWLRLLWLPAGRHEYLFVADNIWLLDPEADDYVPNVYGTLNAVVNVAPAPAAARCRRRRDQTSAPTASRTSLSKNGVHSIY